MPATKRKMSTTGGSVSGTVYVLDQPGAILKKFRSSVTDSGSEVHRGRDKPGITNLIEILAAVRGASPEAVEADFHGSGYGAFKTALADLAASGNYVRPALSEGTEFTLIGGRHPVVEAALLRQGGSDLMADQDAGQVGGRLGFRQPVGQRQGSNAEQMMQQAPRVGRPSDPGVE